MQKTLSPPSKPRSFVVRLAFAGSLMNPGCTDRPAPTDDSCFPADPWADDRDDARECLDNGECSITEHSALLLDIGFCEYSPDEFDDVLPGYTRAHFTEAYYCVESDTCERCPSEDELEEIDRELHEDYQRYLERNQCPDDEREVLAYTRGCSFERELYGDGQRWCCYSGALVSQCGINR